MVGTESELAETLRRMLDATARVTGPDFFAALARTTAEVLDARIAFVGERVAPNSIRVVASWVDGAPGEPFVYALHGTPCANVLAGDTCQYPAEVQRQFPEDTMLADLGIHAYYGVPVSSVGGSRLGIIVALDRRPREVIPDLDIVLGGFAARVATEMERQRAAETVRRSEHQLRQIIESTTEGVWVIDAQTRTTLVNRPLAEMLGYTTEDMLGRPLFDFMDEQARAQAELHLGRRRRGIRERHTFRLRHKLGNDVWVVMASNPLVDAAGAYQGALAVVSDTTERRALELKVQHTQKLESLAVLAGGIAHDFNTLLVGVLGNVGLALELASHESPLVPLLEDIQIAATRAADLTRQMLAYSGRGRFVIEPISVNAIVDEMTHLLGSVISKNAVLKTDLAPELPRVEVDATQIRQVVMNLVTNASDAVGDRPGIISITTGVISATHEYLQDTYLDEGLVEGRYVYLEVSDTGAGMEAATRERIFDPFFTTKFTGRGLGLAATLGILRGHRGAIKVSSEPGGGSSFKVLLPALSDATAGAVPTSPPVVPPPELAGRLVLVVDDEPMIRSVAAQLLEHAGYRVMSAADGEEAVALFQARGDEIACVLLDMTMPKLNGLETFGAMRKLRADVRVVLSSGYTEQEAAQRFVGKGIAGFIAKPWSAAAMVAMIGRAIGGEDG